MHQLLFFVLVLLCTLGAGKIQKGNILLKSDWHFIDKFCFDTHGLGNLTWTAWSPDASNLRLLFYDDQDNSWPEVYPKRHSLSCDEKIAMAKGNRSIVSGVTHFQEFKDTKRPHFWYMVVSNCGGASKVEFQYKFEFVNGGGAWDRQFSFEDQGLPQMYLFYWLVFVVIVVVHARGVWVLFQEKAFHPIVKLLTATIALQFFSLLFLFSHYAAYAKDGVGASGLKGLGELIDMASQLTFMVLLLLLSKGWSITRVQLTGQRILLILVSIMFILYITLFTVDNVTRNVATTFYLYESVPGILLLVMRSLVFLWFLWNLRLTFLDEIHPEKRKFYLIFGGVYSLWFLMLVLIVIIAACFGAYSYWRLKVVTGMYLTVNTLGFSIMAFLLWPSRATQYFQITQPDLLIPSGGQNSFTSNTHYDTL